MSPIASVVLPVCNGQRYLELAIASVLTQTFREFELLLLDDGSTDRSLTIMRAAAERDARCRVYSWPNRGLVATLNAGVELARGDIVVRMDADDVCRPRRFERQMGFLKEHAHCVAVGSYVQFIDPDGLPLFEPELQQFHADIDKSLLTNGFGIAHPASAIRKSALSAVGGYLSKYPHAEDLDLFLRLSEVGGLANIPEILLDYRQHMGSVCYQKAASQFESANRAVADALARRGHRVERPQQLLEPKSVPKNYADVYKLWGWWALKAGNVATARRHAVASVLRQPASWSSWLLLACAVRGH